MTAIFEIIEFLNQHPDETPYIIGAFVLVPIGLVVGELVSKALYRPPPYPEGYS